MNPNNSDSELPGSASVRLQGLSKSFAGAIKALDRVSLDIGAGEFFALLGPSGCGKTTTLRLVAGFETPDEGRIVVGGRDVTEMPVHRREMGVIFQSYALFPHRTVAENVAFGLRMRKIPRQEIDRRVAAALAQVALTGLEGRRPAQLSGGQQQRVALARAIVIEPPVLLCDEPLGALDRRLRQQMQFELKQLQKQLGVTLLFVTHDQEEALALSDRIAVMNAGRIEQVGAPVEIYERPRTRFVAGFIGSPAMNFIPCRLEEVAGNLNIRLTDRIAFPLPPARAARYQNVARDAKLLLGLRPEHIAEAKAHPEPGVEAFDAVLDVIEPMGMETLVYFTLEGSQVCGRVNPNAGARDGAPLRLAVDLNNMHLLNEGTGVVL